ncbi:ABC transporter permease [Halolamina sp. C58]|uniref:ABC transporter permease n=1 Tax=Halolamina sp. C58 TaxID=3421640 RepID=UPI003EBC0319
MSLRTLVEKYALDTHRTKSAWVVAALFVIVFGFVGWSTGGPTYRGEIRPLVVGGVQNSAGILVVLTTLALGHGVVAGARESGSLRVLLAYPHSRREVVLGAFLGRVGPLLAAISGGLLAAPTAYTLRTGQLPGADYLTLVGFVLLWTVFCTALAVGISALASTGRRAIGGAFGVFLGFLFVWDWLPTEIVRRMYPPEQQRPRPEWAQLWVNLDPVTAYQRGTSMLSYPPEGPLAAYETLPFFAAVLAAWAIVPIALALWRFPQTDL